MQLVARTQKSLLKNVQRCQYFCTPDFNIIKCVITILPPMLEGFHGALLCYCMPDD